VAEAHPSLAAQGEAEGHEVLDAPGPPGPGRRHGGQPFGTEAARAVAIAAAPLVHAELQTHLIGRPGQVGAGAFVRTGEPPRRGGTQRTRGQRRHRAHAPGERCGGGVDMTRVKA